MTRLSEVISFEERRAERLKKEMEGHLSLIKDSAEDKNVFMVQEHVKRYDYLKQTVNGIESVLRELNYVEDETVESSDIIAYGRLEVKAALVMEKYSRGELTWDELKERCAYLTKVSENTKVLNIEWDKEETIEECMTMAYWIVEGSISEEEIKEFIAERQKWEAMI